MVTDTATDFVYAKARIALGSGSINLLSSNVQAMLVNSNYSPSPTNDQYVSSIPSNAIVKRDAVLTSKRFTSQGYFAGNVPTYVAFANAMPVVGVVLYINSGTDGSSQLLYYSSTGVGLPFLPAGFDYYVGYDQSIGGWFQP